MLTMVFSEDLYLIWALQGSKQGEPGDKEPERL